MSIRQGTKIIAGSGNIISDFTGATSTTDGSHGLVPAPTKSDIEKFLKSDGSWKTVTVSEVSSQSSGTVKFWTGSQTEYDALGTYSNDTIYLITE